MQATTRRRSGKELADCLINLDLRLGTSLPCWCVCTKFIRSTYASYIAKGKVPLRFLRPRAALRSDEGCTKVRGTERGTNPGRVVLSLCCLPLLPLRSFLMISIPRPYLNPVKDQVRLWTGTTLKNGLHLT